MSQIVTKQSLNALATLVFAGIRLEGDRCKPEYNMDAGASDGFHALLECAYPERTETAEQRLFASGFGEGIEFGLAVAAAIVTHGLDSVAATEAVRAELNADRYWPESKAEAA
ncbi:MAG TPA: hypothetical protein VIW73_13530 [Candidatus Cybelea sp.]